jgi:hypothetical protein
MAFFQAPVQLPRVAAIQVPSRDEERQDERGREPHERGREPYG